ncbi:basic salivary proline-rich protein 4-like [Elephas maximus indicus]|uniref:basic salivary proline-rich protein 4-like n=1 Tax=Elephas maximus indicus TaxID=99487 RepID=UPI002116A065|nr:basic salivary proline-rich protein 4-like [Elephas maximus indicus]
MGSRGGGSAAAAAPRRYRRRRASSARSGSFPVHLAGWRRPQELPGPRERSPALPWRRGPGGSGAEGRLAQCAWVVPGSSTPPPNAKICGSEGCNKEGAPPPQPAILGSGQDMKSSARLGRTQLPRQPFDLWGPVCSLGTRPGRGPDGHPPCPSPGRGLFELGAPRGSTLSLGLSPEAARAGRGLARGWASRASQRHPPHPAPGRAASERTASLGARPPGAPGVFVRPKGLGWGAGSESAVLESENRESSLPIPSPPQITAIKLCPHVHLCRQWAAGSSREPEGVEMQGEGLRDRTSPPGLQAAAPQPPRGPKSKRASLPSHPAPPQKSFQEDAAVCSPERVSVLPKVTQRVGVRVGLTSPGGACCPAPPTVRAEIPTPAPSPSRVDYRERDPLCGSGGQGAARAGVGSEHFLIGPALPRRREEDARAGGRAQGRTRRRAPPRGDRERRPGRAGPALAPSPSFSASSPRGCRAQAASDPSCRSSLLLFPLPVWHGHH